MNLRNSSNDLKLIKKSLLKSKITPTYLPTYFVRNNKKNKPEIINWNDLIRIFVFDDANIYNKPKIQCRVTVCFHCCDIIRIMFVCRLSFIVTIFLLFFTGTFKKKKKRKRHRVAAVAHHQRTSTKMFICAYVKDNNTFILYY